MSEYRDRRTSPCKRRVDRRNSGRSEADWRRRWRVPAQRMRPLGRQMSQSRNCPYTTKFNDESQLVK